MRIVTVNLPEAYLTAIDALCGDENKIYPSRSEMIRVALREFLSKELETAKAFTIQFKTFKNQGYTVFQPRPPDNDEDLDSLEKLTSIARGLEQKSIDRHEKRTQALAEAAEIIENDAVEKTEAKQQTKREQRQKRKHREPIDNIYWDKSGPIPVRKIPELQNYQEDF